MQNISQNVYVETGFRGCNVSFVVTREGVVMIDTPMVPTEAIKWREEIANHGQLRYVVNNEPHMDHISGDYFFGGTLVTHDGTREVIAKSPVAPLIDMLKRQAPESLPLPPDYHFRLPDITFSHQLTLHVGDHTFKMMHLPGHSPSQLAVYVPQERVVFTSDNVVNPGPPYLTQALPYKWLESLETISKFDVDTVVPGHGKITDKSYLPKMRATIQNWITIVSEVMAQGLSVEEAQKKLSLETLFPGMPVDDRLRMLKQMNIAHLYEVLKK